MTLTPSYMRAISPKDRNDKDMEIGEQPPPETPSFTHSSHAGIMPYLQEFLTAPHPYRAGVICPFMPRALARDNIYFTYFETEKTDHQLQLLIKSCIEFYKTHHRDPFGALIILFEAEFEVQRLMQAHIYAKANCIRNEIMLGALYKESQAPSLHSDQYFPLRTPTPILVMRDLTVHDLQFLHPRHYGSFSKIKFLNSFIRKFSKLSHKGKTRNELEKAILLRRKYLLVLAIRSGTMLFILAASLYLYQL